MTEGLYFSPSMFTAANLGEEQLDTATVIKYGSILFPKTYNL